LSSIADNWRLRELDLSQAGELEGLWVASGIGDRLAQPPTPLTLDFVLQDSVLLGSAFARRGVSMPKLTRRVARVSGHVYHAALPLIRAARGIAPLDAELVALAFAAEARSELSRLLPARQSASSFGLKRLCSRLCTALERFEPRVLAQETDGSQHYRWLVEMDLGILPDDALGTTLEECVAIERGTRALEFDVTLDLLTAYAAIGVVLRRTDVDFASSLAALVVPEGLEFASTTPATALLSVAQAASRVRSAPDSSPGGRVGGLAAHAGSLDFIDGFGERGPNERELTSPRWKERSESLERVLERVLELDAVQHEQRMATAHRRRREQDERVLGKVNRGDEKLLRALGPIAQGLARLRSRLHLVRARTLSMLRTAVLDIDRRLVRLAGCESGAAFFLELDELLSATTRPSSELSRRSADRRRLWAARAAHPAPPALLGRGGAIDPVDKPLSGTGLGGPDVTGPVTVAHRFEQALVLRPGGVLVVRSLDAGWAPLLPLTAAVVTETGGLADEGVLVALTLGVPLVIGVRGATQNFATGDIIRVSASQGTVVHA
jgi:phosphohistidine swiveling domain-containing protein